MSVLGAVDLFALPLSCYLVVVIYSDSPFVTMSNYPEALFSDN